MKVLTATLMVLGASVPVAMADFDVYFALAADWGNAKGGWFFLDGEPDCDDALNAKDFADRGDVSGSKYGVRCDGDGCMHEGDPNEINELEIHPRDGVHWTLYQNRDWSLVGSEGTVIGTCEPFEGDSWDCLVPIGHTVGHRKFRCTTEYDKDYIEG